MKNEDLLRYNRHILLDGIDVAGQQAIATARVLLIGAGGLGCPAALYLAAAGVHTLTVVDDDFVELSNLQRQIAFAEPDLGRPKVSVLAEQVSQRNAAVRCHPIMDRADAELMEQLLCDHHLVLDATDNFATRHLINALSVALERPLVSGAAIRWEGQVSVFDPRIAGSPCYACLYAPGGEENLSCAEAGVFAPLCGLVGSLMAGEALKLLVGDPDVLCGRLLLIDQRRLDIRTLRIARDPACPVCGGSSAGVLTAPRG